MSVVVGFNGNLFADSYRCCCGVVWQIVCLGPIFVVVGVHVKLRV
jgi:hypothetical protein